MILTLKWEKFKNKVKKKKRKSENDYVMKLT